MTSINSYKARSMFVRRVRRFPVRNEIVRGLESIRPPKREQLQFLFLSLGCCTAAVQLQYAPPKGRWMLNLHIIFDESASFCHMVGQQSRDACILRRSAGQDWEIRTEPVPFSEGESSLFTARRIAQGENAQTRQTSRLYIY
jgi:hypothetical protein